MFFSVFPVFMDIEDFYPPFKFAPDILAQAFFEFLDVGVLEVIMIPIFFFVVGQSQEAVPRVQRRVKNTAARELVRAPFAAYNTLAAIKYSVRKMQPHFVD